MLTRFKDVGVRVALSLAISFISLSPHMMTPVHAESSERALKKAERSLKEVKKVTKIKADLKNTDQIEDALKIFKEVERDISGLTEAVQKIAQKSTSSKVKGARKKLIKYVQKFKDKFKKAFEKLERNQSSPDQAKVAKSPIKDMQKSTRDIESSLKDLSAELQRAQKSSEKTHKQLNDRLKKLAEKTKQAGSAKGEKRAQKLIKRATELGKKVSALKGGDPESEEIKKQWPKSIKSFKSAAEHLVFLKKNQKGLKASINQCKKDRGELKETAQQYEQKPSKSSKKNLEAVAGAIQKRSRAALKSGKKLHKKMKSARQKAKFSGGKDWALVKSQLQGAVDQSFKGWETSYDKLKKICGKLKNAKKHKAVTQAGKSSKVEKHQKKLAAFEAASGNKSGCYSIPYAKGIKKCGKLQKKVTQHCKTNSGSCSKIKTYAKVDLIETYQKKIDQGKDVQKSQRLLKQTQDELEQFVEKIPEQLKRTKKCYFSRVKVQKHYDAMDEKVKREKHPEIVRLGEVIIKNHVKSKEDHEIAYKQDKLAWQKCVAAQEQETFPKLNDMELTEMD